ncbi:hypothetical protein OLMES_2153 [Oleiphilus messinensis]|uniref:Uncharacterized protein n=1 Tax=Oleiphilus messinensis TaxID=141451 RepID=A0A1Y0I9X1_9GAMM|nr:hypothetical protein OLMES_2153 [Oleiphilus messinensis]
MFLQVVFVHKIKLSALGFKCLLPVMVELSTGVVSVGGENCFVVGDLRGGAVLIEVAGAIRF